MIWIVSRLLRIQPLHGTLTPMLEYEKDRLTKSTWKKVYWYITNIDTLYRCNVCIKFELELYDLIKWF